MIWYHKKNDVTQKNCASHVPIDVLICPQDSFREHIGHFLPILKTRIENCFKSISFYQLVLGADNCGHSITWHLGTLWVKSSPVTSFSLLCNRVFPKLQATQSANYFFIAFIFFVKFVIVTGKFGGIYGTQSSN